MSELSHVTVVRDTRSLWTYQRGETGRPFLQDDAWFIACPQCCGFCSLRGWNVTEHEDETVTVRPSILCYGSAREPCGAHYFITHNQLEWV